MAGPAIIDLFAGAGGLSAGALAAGGDVRLLVDHDRDSCETARLSHPEGVGVVEGDVAKLTGQELRRLAGIEAAAPLMVVGGPPVSHFRRQRTGWSLEPRRPTGAGVHRVSSHYAPNRSRLRGQTVGGRLSRNIGGFCVRLTRTRLSSRTFPAFSTRAIAPL